MYFTPRGKDQREQKIIDFSTAQKLLEIAVSGQEISVFFERFEIKRIGIAPFNHFGQCLVRMLQNKSITTKCFMDKRYDKFNSGGYMGIPIKDYGYLTEDEVDAVIVTSNFYFNDIVDTLLEHNIPLEKVIGINTILYGLERLERL